MSEIKTKVVCYNCRKLVDKDKAFYIAPFDTYLCEKCYLDMLNGKPVRLSNWRKAGV